MTRLLIPVLAVLALGLLPGSASAATCSDFSNQAAAQAAANTRDGDGDGIYCESLPCPCSTGAGSAPPPPPPYTPPTTTSPPTPPAPIEETPEPIEETPEPTRFGKRIAAQIVSVIDGDTVKVRTSSGSRVTVRMIGIDTPETRKPGTPVECGGPPATAALKRLAFDRRRKGRAVTLITDPTQDLRDRFGRLLAYVRLTSGGTDLGAKQIAAGWSSAYVYESPFQKLPAYQSHEQAAKASQRGVWGACGGNFHSAG